MDNVRRTYTLIKLAGAERVKHLSLYMYITTCLVHLATAEQFGLFSYYM